ncbi:MAG: RNA degradosome polyphosphate kinase, partial [Acidobacteriota bacterium]|nr:RNA degradosome polyphosphate kinase [Acidobacteriota bacterium]
MTTSSPKTIDPASPNAYINRELSWLGFARRVLSLVANRDLPQMETDNYAAINGMLHPEYFKKRKSGLKPQNKQ